MDVLLRLATEEPDLSGLPDDLAGLITACMYRGAQRTASPHRRRWPISGTSPRRRAARTRSTPTCPRRRWR